MGEAIEQRRRHLGVAEHVAPLAEAQVGSDDHAGPLVELAEQVEQQGAARRTERQIAKLVQDHEIQAEQTVGELPSSVGGFLLLQRVNQVDCGKEPDLLAAVLNALRWIVAFGLTRCVTSSL
jgi:hypothetical protein